MLLSIAVTLTTVFAIALVVIAFFNSLRVLSPYYKGFIWNPLALWKAIRDDFRD